MADKPVDVGDEREVQSRKDKLANFRQREMEELRRVLSSPGGRYFVWRLLSECGIWKDDRGSSSERLHERAGERGIGNWTLAEVLEAYPEIEHQLRSEGAARDKEKDEVNARSKRKSDDD